MLKIDFYSLSPNLVRYIMKFCDNPINRKVCKAWKTYYGNIYYNKWIQLEKHQNEPESFKIRLTMIRENFERTFPELKNDGFNLIHFYFKELLKSWKPGFQFKNGLQLDTIRDILYHAISNESLIKFTGEWEVSEAIKYIKCQPYDFTVNKCQLDHLPSEIEFLNAHLLHFTNNRLTDLPEALVKIPYLSELELSHNCFVKFPKILCSLKNLNRLYLNDNQLKKIPKEIGLMKNLYYLDLDGNKLTHLPKEIGLMKNLYRLRLNGNKLTHLPAEIGKLKKLEYLYLHDNELSEIPFGICYLEKLRDISLERNKPTGQRKITRIPTVYVRYYKKWMIQKMQNRLEKQLNLFFNFSMLKAERATKALNPLSRLYKAMISGNNLKLFIDALSHEDYHLLRLMVIECEKEHNPSSQLLIDVDDEKNSKEEICLDVCPEVFHRALIETIFQKSEKVHADDIEMDHSLKFTTDEDQLKELQQSNLVDLANKKGF